MMFFDVTTTTSYKIRYSRVYFAVKPYCSVIYGCIRLLHEVGVLNCNKCNTSVI